MKRIVSYLCCVVTAFWGLSVSHVLYSVCPIITPVNNPTYNSINPITGENAWQIIKRTADAIDDVGPIIVGSTTELNDLAYTTSLSCPCLCFITQGDVPNYVITNPGVYCVAEPITLGDTGGLPVIDVQADNVVIDFRGNLVSCSLDDAVAVVKINNHQSVIIKNGVFDISPDSISSDIGFGIDLQNASDIIIQNCNMRMRSASGGANYASIYCVSTDNVLIENCEIIDSQSSAFYMYQTNNVIFRHCRSFYPLGAGFQSEGFSFNTIFDTCYAYGGNVGFLSTYDDARMTFINCISEASNNNGFYVCAQHSLIRGCVASGNGSNGFFINPSSIAGILIEVVGCTAFGNAQYGFLNGVLAESYIFNCVAAQNSFSNYFDVTAATLIPAASVNTSTGYWSNING